jgi:hypothetical protein
LYPLIGAGAGGLAAFMVTSQLSSPWPKLLLGTLVFLVVYVLVMARWALELKRMATGLYGRRRADDEPIAAWADEMTMEAPMAGGLAAPIGDHDHAGATAEIPRIWPGTPRADHYDDDASMPLPRRASEAPWATRGDDTR